MDLRVVANDLRLAPSEEEFQLHCAALEWSLAEPIIINSAEDIKSRADWKDRVEPYHHQVQNLMRFCRRLPVTLLADDVGLGKTISAGLIVSELMKRNRVNKVFVVCPKILIPQWVEELDSKFGISAYGAVGSELRGSHQRSESVIVTTYQSATGFLERQQQGLFDMLILDEAHKVRNLHGTQSPPKMARAIFNALSARMFKYVVMLTATPIQNRLWDIYSLIDCLAVARGHKNPLGTPDQFATRFIADGKNVARHLVPNQTKEFRNIVNSYMFRTRRIDAKLAFPDRQVQTYPIQPSREELELQEIIAERISQFNGLIQTSMLVALMSSPQALEVQLSKMASTGTVEMDLARQVTSLTQQIRVPAKAKAVLKIAADLRSQGPKWRMVIFTTRIATQAMLGEVLGKEGIQYGFISGGEPEKNRRTIEMFRQEQPQINVIVSTDAGAEGVNLQAANILVNYDLPWNPMIVEQRIGRVQRIGSKFKSVWVANVVHHNSPEERIVVRLMEKLQVISHTVGDIEAVLEATNDSDGKSLERQIRQMVVASLQGQDQQAAARMAEESIDRAKRLIEENQEEIDRTLGGSQDADQADVPMPRLSPASPSIPLKEFVYAALEAEGAEIVELGEGLMLSRNRSLGEEKFTFDQSVYEKFTRPGVFMGRAPLLYQPGKPAFERLVQRWIDRSGALIEDHRCSQEEAGIIASSWVASVPNAVFDGVEIDERSEGFTGQLVCRTRVANSIDSYEKLISMDYVQALGSRARSVDLSRSIRANSLVPDLDVCVSGSVDGDSDITKFKEYYDSRLNLELSKSDSGDRQTKLLNDLQVSVTSDASAVKGRLTERVVLIVDYRLGGDQVFTSMINVEGGQVVGEPDRAECELTNVLVPIDCLATCAFSGRKAIKDQMQISGESGLWAFPSELIRCEHTGREVHESETAVCCVTEKRVSISETAKSEVSGRIALRQHVTRCQITDALLIVDEVEVSGISGKGFRADQTVVLSDKSTKAHTTEAEKCVFTGEWLAADEVMQSKASGKLMAKTRAVASEISGLQCDETEIEHCEVSGIKALPDELDLCSVSGKRVRKNLLKACPETFLHALVECFERCEISGESVLPKGLGTCSLTGLTAKKSLLGKSDLSGKYCRLDQLSVCEETEDRVLPDELARCAVTNKMVRVDLLRVCPETGKRAMESCFGMCEESKDKVIQEGLGRCALTGKRVRKSLLGFSQISNEVCLASRLVKCEETGLLAIPGELDRCGVSGKLVRQDLLRICPETGANAMVKFFEKCEDTNDLVSPDGLGMCCETKRKIKKSLLGRSDVSGKQCSLTLLKLCAKTSAKLLPSEAQKCEVTNLLVDKRQLSQCAASGRFVLTTELLQSKASGKWMLKEYTRTLPNGVVVGAKEVELCVWSRKYLRVDKTAICNLTGLVFDKSLMNTSGELSVLRDCLDGKTKGNAFPEAGFLARAAPQVFGGITLFQWVTSSARKTHVMFGKKSTLGINAKVFAVIAEGDLHGLRLKGNALFGKRAKGIWQETERHKFG